jgi:hypothetical protein
MPSVVLDQTGTAALENLRLIIENAVVRGADATVYRSSQPQRVLRESGRDLFSSIFLNPTAIRDQYLMSKAKLDDNDPPKNLRIKLRIKPLELASLPWEYLYEEGEAEPYVSLRQPILRYLGAGEAPRSTRVRGPLRILGMVANPTSSNWPQLDEWAERRRIEDAIERLQIGGQPVEFEWVPGGTGGDLMLKLMEKEWHIFHFVGHGGFDNPGSEDGKPDGAEDISESSGQSGFIVLLDENGAPKKRFACHLSAFLNQGRPSLRLAVLNCCEGARIDTRTKTGSPAIALLQSGPLYASRKVSTARWRGTVQLMTL